MDALTFGSNVLLRHITVSEARKLPVQEFHLEKILEGLNLSQKEVLGSLIILNCYFNVVFLVY